MIQIFYSPLIPVWGYIFLRSSTIWRHYLKTGNFFEIALSTASSSSSSSRSSSDSDSSSSPWSDYLLASFLTFLFFFFFDLGGRGMFIEVSHFSCFYFWSFFSLSSSKPRIFHSAGLTKCSKAVGSSISSFKSLSLFKQTFIAVVTTFGFTEVFISPSSLYAVYLSSLIYFLIHDSAFTALYSWAKSSYSSCNARS